MQCSFEGFERSYSEAYLYGNTFITTSSPPAINADIFYGILAIDDLAGDFITGDGPDGAYREFVCFGPVGPLEHIIDFVSDGKHDYSCPS